MGYVIGLIVLVNLVLFVALAISQAMVGDWRMVIDLGKFCLVLVGIVVASWIPIWAIHSFRWLGRKLTNL